MSFDFVVENEADIAQLLQRLPPGIFERVQQILANGTIQIAEAARENAPVRTGHLMASIHPVVGDMEDADEAFQPLAVAVDADYATYVEEGTRKMEAEPFLGPAVDELEPQILEEISTVMAELGLEPGDEEA